jgi:hypothetical protein
MLRVVYANYVITHERNLIAGDTSSLCLYPGDKERFVQPATNAAGFNCTANVLLSFVAVCGSDYSWRSASIGRLRAALRAGVMPKIIPTDIATATAMTIICQVRIGSSSVNILNR